MGINSPFLQISGVFFWQYFRTPKWHMIWTNGVRQTASRGNVPPRCRPRLSIALRPSVRLSVLRLRKIYIISLLFYRSAVPRRGSTRLFDRSVLQIEITFFRAALVVLAPTGQRSSALRMAVLRGPRTIKLLTMIDAHQRPCTDRLYFATGEYRVSTNI